MKTKSSQIILPLLALLVIPAVTVSALPDPVFKYVNYWDGQFGNQTIYQIAFSQDSSRMLLWPTPGVTVFDTKNWEIINELHPPTYLTDANFSFDGKRVATASLANDAYLRVFDVDTGEVLAKQNLASIMTLFGGVALDNFGNHLIYYHKDFLNILDVETNQITQKIDLGENLTPADIHYLSSNNVFIDSNFSKYPSTIVDLKTGNSLLKISGSHQIISSNLETIYSFTFSENFFGAWDTNSLKQIINSNLNPKNRFSVFGPDRKTILQKSNKGYMVAEIVNGGKIVQHQTISFSNFPLSRRKGNDAYGLPIISPDGRYIAIRAGHTAYVYNADEFLSHAKGAEQY